MFYSPHPLLRKRETETATVSYSELLFDLIYVFSVTQLSHYLLHNLTWEGLLKETILWFAVWMLWQHTIWVTNWFNPDTRPIRILLFISMLVGLVMAAAAFFVSSVASSAGAISGRFSSSVTLMGRSVTFRTTRYTVFPSVNLLPLRVIGSPFSVMGSPSVM